MINVPPRRQLSGQLFLQHHCLQNVHSRTTTGLFMASQVRRVIGLVQSTFFAEVLLLLRLRRMESIDVS